MTMRVTEHDKDGDTDVIELSVSGYLYYVRISPTDMPQVYTFDRRGKFYAVYDAGMISCARQYLASMNR